MTRAPKECPIKMRRLGHSVRAIRSASRIPVIDAFTMAECQGFRISRLRTVACPRTPEAADVARKARWRMLAVNADCVAPDPKVLPSSSSRLDSQETKYSGFLR